MTVLALLGLGAIFCSHLPVAYDKKSNRSLQIWGRTTSGAIRNVETFDYSLPTPREKHFNFSPSLPFLCLPTPAVLLPFVFSFLDRRNVQNIFFF